MGSIRGNPVYQALVDVLAENGITEHSVEQGSKQPRIVFRIGGRTLKYSFPATPSDQRSIANSSADLWRIIDRETAPAADGECLPAVTPETVYFRGTAIPTVMLDGEPHVALKPIVEAMGVDWNGQFQRSQRDPVLSTCMCVTHMQIGGQRRDVTVLPLKYLNGFLFGIDSSRVRESIRDNVIAYQRECYDALRAYWFDGAAIRTDAGPAKLDADAKRAIGGIVKSITNAQHQEAMRQISALKAEMDAIKRRPAIPAFDLSDSVTSLQLVEMAGIPADQRIRNLTGRVTKQARDWCSERGIPHRQTPEDINSSKPWRFPRDQITRWLHEHGGAQWIRTLVEAMRFRAGKDGAQGVLLPFRGRGR